MNGFHENKLGQILISLLPRFRYTSLEVREGSGVADGSSCTGEVIPGVHQLS